jgi:hypothetical protein
MSFWRPLWAVAVTVAICGAGLAQAPSPGLPSGLPTANVQPPKLPPLPYDPLELVTSDAQQIQDADQRAAAISMLTNARALSNVRAQPYDLKTTFKSFGSLPSDGTWTLEDASPSRNIYRWTAQGPSYSATYLYTNKLLSSNQPAVAIPLRLAQVREAIFFIYPWASRYTSLRAAVGYLHGVELRCILLAQAFGGRSFQGGRNWEESEYCVDPKSGLLATYSPVPGLYIQYDYTNAIHFHNEIIPEGFTISEAGRIIIEAKTQSVTDPVNPNNRIFDPSGLHSLGVGSVMEPSMWVRDAIYPPQPHVLPDANATLQLVVVHGIVSPDGQIGETEILASTNPSLNQAALDRANGWKPGQVSGEVQPGTTPQSREIIFTLQAVNPPR